MNIRVGQMFDTPFEQGCKVAALPNEYGRFDAYDSDGVLCSFILEMVTKVY